MLWYKSWLETRWRFLIGLVLLLCSAALTVFAYPQVMKLMPMLPALDLGGEIGQRIKESAELTRDYRSYVWSQWFRQNLPQLWTLFAVVLGSGGLLSQASGGAALFTLSLPVSRHRLLTVRGAAGLGELLLLAVLPSLFVLLLSPAVGQTYRLDDALIHSACLFLAGAVFFSLAFFLSTVFGDLWRPLLIGVSVAIALALCEQASPDLSRYGIFRVMGAEVYFRAGELPWQGLLVSAAASAAMLYGATLSMARRDF